MRRVKPTLETVPSDRGGRLGDVESLLGSGDVVFVVLMISSVPLSVVVLAESGSAQGDNDKACTTSDANSSTILTRIAHRTCLDRRTQGHYMPVPCPCRGHAAGLPTAARARLPNIPYPYPDPYPYRTGQGIADNDKRYFQCCTPPLRSDILGLRAPPPVSLAIASLRLHVNSIPPACCQRRQRAVCTSPLSSWRCGDATCALYRQHSARRPSRATLPLAIRGEKTRRRGGSSGKVLLQSQSLRLQAGASCTPLHASRGRRDVSGLVQLAAYHHETGIRSACTKRVNPSGLTAAGSTAHLHPNTDNVFK